MSLFSMVQITLIKIPLMILLKFWLSSVQFLTTSPVSPIYLSVDYSTKMNLFFINRLIINEEKDLLKSKSLVKSFHFINQNNGWTLNNGTLDFSLFYSDALHLVQKGNLKLGKSVLKAIDSNSSANPYKIQYASI